MELSLVHLPRLVDFVNRFLNHWPQCCVHGHPTMKLQFEVSFKMNSSSGAGRPVWCSMQRVGKGVSFESERHPGGDGLQSHCGCGVGLFCRRRTVSVEAGPLFVHRSAHGLLMGWGSCTGHPPWRRVSQISSGLSCGSTDSHDAPGPRSFLGISAEHRPRQQMQQMETCLLHKLSGRPGGSGSRPPHCCSTGQGPIYTATLRSCRITEI